MRKCLQCRWLLLAMLVVAAALRVAFGLWWQNRLPPGQRFGFPDSESYWQLARTVAHGEPYRYGAYAVFRTPGYPALLAPLFWIWPDPPVLAARMLSAALGTATVALVGLHARVLFDRSAQGVALVLAALYPGAIALSFVVLSEAPFCPLMLGQLLGWTLAAKSATRRPRVLWALGGGVCAGLATLMRPSWLLFTPLAAAIALVVCAQDRKRHLEMGLVMLVALGATLAPWWLRNYAVSGRFIPTTLQVGPSLYDGLNEAATGASDMRFVAAFEAEIARTPGTRIEQELALNEATRRAALNWAAQHPGRVLELAGVKFLRLWNVWPNASEFGSLWLRLAVAAAYVPVLTLALWGVWRFARRGWPYLLCVLPAGYCTLLHLVFVGSVRYREPAMLPLLVLAAGACASSRVCERFLTSSSSNGRACIGS